MNRATTAKGSKGSMSTKIEWADMTLRIICFLLAVALLTGLACAKPEGGKGNGVEFMESC